MLKNKILLFLFLLSTHLFSQNSLKDSLLYFNISKKLKSYNFKNHLNKASIFFNQQNWDSTLIYTNIQLTSFNQSLIVKDYSHFLRGHSFKKKDLDIEALKQFNLISFDFDFYEVVKIRLGEIYIKEKKYKKALALFLEISKLSKKEHPYIKQKNIIHNIGICHLQLKNYKEAENYFLESLEDENDTLELIFSYTNIATLYYDQYKDNIAISYFKKAYDLSRNTENHDSRRFTSKNMSIIEENRKEFQKALIYRKEMERWKDSLNDQNKIYEVAKLEKEFAVKEKQKEVDILQVKNELQATQRTIFLYAAIGLLILLSISIYFYREKVKRNKIIAHQKENLDVLNATKDKLFSIVSHDLRSSVNALKTSNSVLLDNLASKNIVALGNLLKKNSAIVNGAYGLLDNLLHWALSQTKQGYFEITATRLFFMVEQMAYNYKPLMLEKNIQFENKVLKKAIAFADQESLKLVIRNLLDNAIKFSTKDGIIKVYSRNKQEGYCDLIVEDTGMGMSNDTRLKLLEDTLLLSKKEHETVIGTGLGLQLCKTMIKKNNGKFSIESELGIGTKMIVSLPKKQDNG
ncbi:tetratricopeptide repeat-containing sensor histidine kinase [Tenacibaculum ovolyticum]|uniref:tetratricopeptide repeat-containing sensor histidine kinase n=1 Tax=Tenacibaculum ovolyticum TaxID=104270 RepID=UPI0007EE0F92|nr:tetratricopeptide repeat-containing sensor histidine kinase [Tenacibaculum ovolyticum]